MANLPIQPEKQALREAKQKLTIELIKNSLILKDFQKSLLLAILNDLSTTEMARLCTALGKEKTIFRQIEQKYQQKLALLSNLYLKTIKDFSHTGVKQALNNWEEQNIYSENKQLDKLINELVIDDTNNPPDTKI